MDTLISYFQQSNNNAVYNVLDALSSFLRGNKKLKTFTFIIPDTTDLVEMQSKLQNDDDDEALDILKRYILLVQINSIADVQQIKDRIPNMFNKRLPIERIGRSSFTLTNKTEISFVKMLNNVSIWQANGTVEKGSERVEAITEHEVKIAPSVTIRTKLYEEVSRLPNIAEGCLRHVVSLLSYINTEINSNLGKIISYFLDFCPITSFIILFEPGKRGNFFISDTIINNWFHVRKSFNNNEALFIRYAKVANCGMYKKETIMQLNKIRQDILELNTSVDLATAIKDLYDDLVNRNTVGSIVGVLPREVHSYLKERSTESNIKLFQDEIRSIVSTLLETVSEAETIRSIYRSLRALPTFNNISIASSSSAAAFNSSILCFANSTYLLYMMPPKKGYFGGTSKLYTDISPEDDHYTDPVSMKFYDAVELNSNNDLLDALRDIKRSGGRITDPEIVSLFNSLS